MSTSDELSRPYKARKLVQGRLFQRSADIALEDRTVGVISRDDEGVMDGYVLFSSGPVTYLVDVDGGVVHEWESDYVVFASYLLKNGNLLRDGNENLDAPSFATGGAAGRVEEVDWEGNVVWSFACTPFTKYLSHHTVVEMPNGNILLLIWARRSKEEALANGRRPDLLPDGELWEEQVLELKPDRERGIAEVVWRWCMWDHLVQDVFPDKKNFGSVQDSPHKFDFNCCPSGGKMGQRRQTNLDKRLGGPKNGALPPMTGRPGVTGEKDWCHVNSVAYCEKRDQIFLSFNSHCEIMAIDHSTTAEEVRTSEGGRRGKGGDFLYRWGNPVNYGRGSRTTQKLFVQHDITVIPEGSPGAGNILVFNNGRHPDRQWSAIDEIELPEETRYSGDYILPEEDPWATFGPEKPCWSYGPKRFREGSFFCGNISSARRLPNGNTLINQGTLGIFVEINKDGKEVWRYVVPSIGSRHLNKGSVGYLRQGDYPPEGCDRHFFVATKYAPDFPALASRTLKRYRYVEA
mmetsp:Transcript_21725/g.42693  ORF Transcript_21725/g.42693 Transcript_21725/m.42693 type:complete len:518 (+) Transcript_21725:279-1832(+)|eukprot:CAMPEP_0171560170 /NCGR_PEP_ID=MMETSP0960-20121227/13379_1 /TAXON_ID=87120 /ORGANISM="Aurantiochytrium limacinum, Strain ATCCMYA-1381" /LENGTH=517 /DNA_ID=CAMNT_0012112003 /DNA_START=174 /DNA_END=1727 /DNA_ORIENTATION=-